MFLLLLSALLLTVIIVLKRKLADSGVLYWIILLLGFVYMAVDEAWLIHERLIKPMQQLLGRWQ